MRVLGKFQPSRGVPQIPTRLREAAFSRKREKDAPLLPSRTPWDKTLPPCPARVSENHTAFARKLRREMTQAEAMLWRSLRGGGLDGLKFRGQVPIGCYVVDFLCIRHRLVVELDGAPHDRDEQKGAATPRATPGCANMAIASSGFATNW